MSMTTTTESTNGFEPSAEVIRALLAVPREARLQIMIAMTSFSESVDEQLRGLTQILDDPNAAVEDKASAAETIRETFLVHCGSEEWGATLSEIGSRTVGRNPEADHIEDHLDSQEDYFCKKIRELMKEKGLTQVDLANRLGKQQAAISQLLSRGCRPQKRTILKFAEVLDVAPTELWPNIEVTEILDTVAAAQVHDSPLTVEEAAALEKASRRKPIASRGKPLKKLKR